MSKVIAKLRPYLRVDSVKSDIRSDMCVKKIKIIRCAVVLLTCFFVVEVFFYFFASFWALV